MTDDKYESTIFKCSCWADAVEVGSDEDGFVSLCMWSMGTGPNCKSIWERIRWAWHVLVRDKYFHDELLLTPETANSLSEAILKHSSRATEFERSRKERKPD